MPEDQGAVAQDALLPTEGQDAAAVAERPAGHCVDEDAWTRFVARYGHQDRTELGMGHMTDFELANAQFMADRNSLDLIVFQTAAKDRIRWLSIQLANALAHQAPVSPAEQVETDWIEWAGGENPVPGKEVRVRLRDDTENEGWSETYAWAWFAPNSDWEEDIIAYRVLPTPPAEGAGR